MYANCPYRCELCPAGKNYVPGYGPRPARIMLIGEQPGKEENFKRIPLIGKTGKEVDNTYLPLAGLMRQDVYTTNTVKCSTADSGKEPSAALIAHCSKHHLPYELQTVQPDIVILCGGVATGLLDPDFDLETEHGIPRTGKLWKWEGTVFPSYHPALGLHQGNRMKDLLEDFETLRAVVNGTYRPVEDEFPKPRYERIVDALEVAAILDGRQYDPLAIDSEGQRDSKGHFPWSVQFCLDPGTAYIIKREDQDAWYEFAYQIQDFSQIIMHNAVHDITELGLADMPISWSKIQDTMARAYHLGLPQGLKPLARRLCGMKMQSFMDLVKPYSTERAMEYLAEAAAREWTVPEPEPTGEWYEKICPKCKGKGEFKYRKVKGAPPRPPKAPDRIQCVECWGSGVVKAQKYSRKHGVGQNLNRLMGDWIKGEVKDVWERWDNWGDKTREIEKVMGMFPRPCITHVPEDKAIWYACKDADATQRVYRVLRRKAVEVRRRLKWAA